MGAAGLTCSTCEMGARGGTGIEIDVTHVPQRETGMTPYEIMLSESQERMLLVVENGREDEVERVFEKWDLDAVRIGHVTDDGLLRVQGSRRRSWPRSPTARWPTRRPLYDRPTSRPAYLADVQRLDVGGARRRPGGRRRLARAARLADDRQQALGLPRSTTTWCAPTRIVLAGLGRRRGARQGHRDARWRCRSTATGATASSIRARGASSRWPRLRATWPVPGATPIGATNCLNFGNPERPEIMWQFVEAVEGIAEACRALDTPITGGNVSLYNETDGTAIYPTPVIGVVGLIEDASRRAGARRSARPATTIVLLGDGQRRPRRQRVPARSLHGLVQGAPPALDLDPETRAASAAAAAAAAGLICSAHDCSDGGLAVALAECCFGTGGLGAEVDVPAETGGLLSRRCARCSASPPRG